MTTSPRIMEIGQIKRNSLLQMLVIVTGYLGGFLLSALIGRALGPEALGAWSATAAASSIVLGFATLGIDSPLARRIAIEPSQASEWLGNGIGIRMLITLPLSCGLIPLVTMTANKGVVSLEFALLYALYAAFAGVVGLLNRGCQVLQRFLWQLMPVLLGTLPALAAGFLWIRHGGGLLEAVICTATGQIIGVLGLSFMLRGAANPRPRCNRRIWKQLLAESWPLAVSAPFLAAYARVDSVLLLNLQGAESVGFYNAAYGFYMAFGGVASAAQSALFPALAKAYAESPDAAYRLFKRGLRWMLAMALAGIVGTTFLGRWLLVQVYGAPYAVAVTTLQVLMIGSIFLLLNNTYGMTLNAIGRQRLVPFLTVGGLASNLAANFFLIPRLDFLGAAWATLITEAAVLLIAHVCLIPQFSVAKVSVSA